MDIAVESEEDFADQLKEYHGYADSLRQICKKQEVMQLELEQAEDALESKRLERDNFSQGKTGLLGKNQLSSHPPPSTCFHPFTQATFQYCFRRSESKNVWCCNSGAEGGETETTG